MTEKLNEQFTDRRIGRGDPKNLPPHSPEHPPVNYIARTMFERKAKRHQELHYGILVAASRANLKFKISVDP